MNQEKKLDLERFRYATTVVVHEDEFNGTANRMFKQQRADEDRCLVKICAVKGKTFRLKNPQLLNISSIYPPTPLPPPSLLLHSITCECSMTSIIIAHPDLAFKRVRLRSI